MPRIQQKQLRPKLAKFFLMVEEYGNSLALYTLLLMILLGLWVASPLPSPNLRVETAVISWLAIAFIAFSALHGLLWWVITRKFLHLPSRVNLALATSIKLVKPLHMLTGMLGLGLGFMHGLSLITLGHPWDIYTISGLIALLSLLILTIDGIGLMMSPFLSRKVHRWLALVFILSLLIHLAILFS